MIIQVCVGSSCHLKGSETILSLLKERIDRHDLNGDVTLAGSFCIGACNRNGVTIQLDDEIFTGVSIASLDRFFEDTVLPRVEAERS